MNEFLLAIIGALGIVVIALGLALLIVLDDR
jgi:hypothetical protein